MQAGVVPFHFSRNPVAVFWNSTLKLSCRVRSSSRSPLERKCTYSCSSMACTKITSPVFRTLFTPELRKLADVFKESGYEIRIAGGAVRDILMNIRPVDIDFATTATPTQMKKILEDKQIRMINCGGEKHGTVTARIDDKENFEVTTLRIDKTTDGRWAEVEFTTDWVVDANRRDLTINSMFLDLDGNLYDFFNGTEDLNKRRVRFVGEPDKRIQEDFLRILRYFRFYGRISADPDNHEAATLESIRRNADGLKRISGERIWTELRKIVVGPHAAAILTRMMNLGLASYMGLPDEPDVEELERVWRTCEQFLPKPMTVLTSVLRTESDVENLDGRVKLSNDECGLSFFLIRNRANVELMEYCKTHPDGDPLTPYQHLLAEESISTKLSDALVRCLELLKYRGDSILIDRLSKWEIPKFPISGTMFLDRGLRGPVVGQAMNRLRYLWIVSDFQRTVEDLLQNALPVILKDISEQKAAHSGKRKRKNSS